jgi:serine/threonine-protein kinase
VEATSSVNALHAYALGEAAMWNGRTGDALAAYQRATTFDPKFVQAQMRLAWLYSAEKAEVASASAAGIARGAAANTGEKVKLLAQFCYEMNASGDYDGAAKTMQAYVGRYPRDVEGMKGLARVLRMQGNLQGAVSAAEKGYGRDPFDAEMYAEAQLAMIGMDDYDDALQLETQAERSGVVSTGNSLIAGYLGGNEDVVAKQASAKQVAFAGMTTAHGVPVTYAELYHYGLYLDNVGKIGAGSEVWRVAAAIAGSVPELVSTQAAMLAQGALDRALMENCTVALEMVDVVKSLPKGPDAAFHAGMAAALCGDQPYAEKTIAALQQSYPENTAVALYYVPELQAAAEIGVNEPEKALDSLIALEPYDGISLTPYLRGMAHAALGQMSPAVVDFQTMQGHRGSALLLGGNVFPMADVGVARAYAAHRDRANSAEAYRRFLTLWKDADQGQPLMVEALAKSK